MIIQLATETAEAGSIKWRMVTMQIKEGAEEEKKGLEEKSGKSVNLILTLCWNMPTMPMLP